MIIWIICRVVSVCAIAYLMVAASYWTGSAATAAAQGLMLFVIWALGYGSRK